MKLKFLWYLKGKFHMVSVAFKIKKNSLIGAHNKENVTQDRNSIDSAFSDKFLWPKPNIGKPAI